MLAALTLSTCFLTVGIANPATVTPPRPQQPAEATPIATLEAQFEQAFAAALAASDADTEPVYLLQTWGAVMMSATMLEARRRQQAGLDASALGDVASESVLSRWQQLRPDQGGPRLFRLFEIQDHERRVPGLLDLVARYPDDPLVLWQTAQTLRAVEQVERATELLESYAARNQRSRRAHALLAEHYSALDNTTKHAEVLRRWADVTPADPTLVNQWLGAGLDRLEPDATAVLLDQFLAARPEGPESLNVCAQLAQSKGSSNRARDGGRACVARLAAASDQDSALGKQAVKALAALAAADGDWSALTDNVETLDREAQVRTLAASARVLETPARCSERIELLRAAYEVAGSTEGLYPSIASAVRACDGRPAAQLLFLDLLQSAPSTDVFRVLGAWAVKVNDGWRGELPPSTAAVLEARLESEPEPVDLYRALDVVYQLQEDPERQFDLLLRWQEQHADSLRAEHVTTLAWQLASRGRLDDAFDLVTSRLESRFSTEEAELLWQLLALPQSATDSPGVDQAEWQSALRRADRFAGELIASAEPLRVAYGHLLAARGALARDDQDAVERHYLTAMKTVDYPRQEWGIEMLSAQGSWALDDDGELPQRDSDRLATLAFEICDQTRLKEQHRGATQCARTLLLKSGNADAVVRLADAGEELPADPRSLERLGFEAQSAGDAVLAERAWRRLVEVDPRDPDGWVHLAVFLQKADKVDQLEALLAEARQALPLLPVDLLRAVGRARTAQGRADEAIEILREARAAMPETYNPSWLDAELRQAYGVIGRQRSTASRVASRSSEVPARPGHPESSPPAAAPDEILENATAEELLAAGEALRSGSGGRYDPPAAEALIARAAAKGSALAAYRLALVTGDAAHVSASQIASVETLSRDGDGYAQYLVGTGALTGVAHVRDPQAARRWLELAAQQDQPWAHHNLGYMMEASVGFPEAGPKAARDAYRRAGDLGNVSSLYDLARLTLTPYGAAEPCRDGLQRLERSATTGYPKAVAWLGKLLLYGRGDCVLQDPPAALPWLERAAEIGDSGARFDLGLALLLGSAGDGSSERGLALIEEVAELPNALAIETLFFVHGAGAFATRDAARARALLVDAARLGSDGMSQLRREAAFPPFQQLLGEGISHLERWAADGDLEAQAMLAAFLLQGPRALGNRALRDPERGTSLARGAAEAGDPWGMRLLANALQQGAGIDRDPSEALRWVWRAAEAGDIWSMYQRALELMSGEQVELDVDAALTWLTRAAARGHWRAVGELGRIYAEGRPGIAPDHDRAASWKRRRAELGDSEARGWLRANGYASP